MRLRPYFDFLSVGSQTFPDGNREFCISVSSAVLVHLYPSSANMLMTKNYGEILHHCTSQYLQCVLQEGPRTTIPALPSKFGLFQCSLYTTHWDKVCSVSRSPYCLLKPSLELSLEVLDTGQVMKFHRGPYYLKDLIKEVKFPFQNQLSMGIHYIYLMKGLDIASTVRMNHEGCTIIKALRFLRSLWKSHGTESQT